MSETESIFAVRCKLKFFEDSRTALDLLSPLFPDIEVEYDDDGDTFYCSTDLREVVKSHKPPLRMMQEGSDNIWVDWVIGYTRSDILCLTCAPGYNNEKGIPLEEVQRIDEEFTKLFGDHREPGVYVVSYAWYNGCEEPEPCMPEFTPETLKFVTTKVEAKGKQLQGQFPAEEPEFIVEDLIEDKEGCDERWYHVAYVCPLKRGNIISEIICHVTDGVASIMTIKNAIVEHLSTTGIQGIKPERIAILGIHRVTQSGEFIDA